MALVSYVWLVLSLTFEAALQESSCSAATNLAPVTKLLATKARNALWLQLFVMGVVSMAWVPRIPEIKTANELSDTQFGLVLIASSIGAVLGAQLSGRAIHRFGSRPVFFVAHFLIPRQYEETRFCARARDRNDANFFPRN